MSDDMASAPAERPEASTVIEAGDLAKRYGDLTAAAGVPLEARKGQV